MAGMPVDATWDQDSFRFRNDDGSQTTATWMAAANTTPPDIPVETPFRLRFLVQETAGSNQSEQPYFFLEYRVNTGSGFGSWTQATISSTGGCRAVDSSNISGATPGSADSESTTQQIGSGTLTDGAWVDYTAVVNILSRLSATAGNDEYEIEYTIKFRDINASAGDVFEFRVTVDDNNLNVDTNNGVPLTTNGGTYTNTPSVTVATPTFDQDSFRWRADDGDEENATWLAAANVDPTNLTLDTNYRIRFLVQNTSAVDLFGSSTLYLQYRINTGGGFGSWAIAGFNLPVNTTVTTSQYVGPVSTTQQLGSGTYQEGYATEAVNNVTFSSGSSGNEEIEAEYLLELDSGFASAGDVIELRVVWDDLAAFDTYTNTPNITISSGGPSASGAISATVPALSGAATLDYGASGAITSVVPTLSGTADVTRFASGAIDTTVPTLSGTAVKTVEASGAITGLVPTLSGEADAAAPATEASGAISTTVPTLSGDATVTRFATGAINTTVPALSGDATVIKEATGAITSVVPTLSGTAVLDYGATGAITGLVPALSGDALVTRIASGAIDTPIPTLSGTANVGQSASGAIDSLVPTLSGDATVTKEATGAINTPIPTLSGTAVIDYAASGAITTVVPTISGNATVTKIASGAIDTLVPTLAGTAVLQGAASASGAIDTTIPTLSGTAEVQRFATGAIESLVPVLSGTATKTVEASGAITSVVPTISGTAIKTVEATGAIDTLVPNLTGTADVQGDATTASGAIDSVVPDLAGTATKTVLASGAIESLVPNLLGAATGPAPAEEERPIRGGPFGNWPPRRGIAWRPKDEDVDKILEALEKKDKGKDTKAAVRKRRQKAKKKITAVAAEALAEAVPEANTSLMDTVLRQVDFADLVMQPEASKEEIATRLEQAIIAYLEYQQELDDEEAIAVLLMV